MQVADRVRRVQDNIASACARANRKEKDVTLIAVTKFMPIERIALALNAGIAHIGENRVQELLEKRPFFKEKDATVHFIGQLQTNKVKYIIEQAHCIQSVDRFTLASEIERQAAKANTVQDILVEVNIGGEAQKGGIDESNLFELLGEIQAYDHLRVKGLMCVPPAGTAEEARPYFRKMKELFEASKSVPGVEMLHLSMGMSADYAVAIEEGATMVRVGSALFGPRM